MDAIKFIADPVVLIIVLLVAIAIGLFRHKRQASFGILAISLVYYVFSTPFVSNNLLHYLETNIEGKLHLLADPDLPDKPLDILILAGGISSDLSRGKRFELTTSGDRLLLAVQLIRLNEKSQLWFAEDPIEKQTFTILTKLGISETRLHSLPPARNTSEELQKFKELYKESSSMHTPVLLTSAYHLKRVNLIAERLGVARHFAPANHIGEKTRLKLTNAVPDVVALSGTTKAIREWLAAWFYALKIG